MRVLDWTEKLYDYIKRNRNKEYKIGKFDCVLFASNWIKECINVSILKDIKYSDEKSAFRLLKENNGLFNMTDIQMEKFNLKQQPVKYSERGDIVGFLTEAHGETVGICVGDKFVSPGEDDLIFLLMKEAVKSWRIR